MPRRLLNSKTVEELTSLSHWAIRRLRHKDLFPHPIKPTGNLNYWYESDIDNWLTEQQNCRLKQGGES